MSEKPSKVYSMPDISKTVSEENITHRKRKQPESEVAEAIRMLLQEFNKRMDNLKDDLNSAMSTLSENITNIKSELTKVSQTTIDIKIELNTLRNDHTDLKKNVAKLTSKQQDLSEEVASLQKSVSFTMDIQEDLKVQVKAVSKASGSAETVHQTISSLEAKIDYIEQQARQCNLELCNIPEKRNENLLALVDNIKNKLNFTLSQNDIVSIHRVPHAHKENSKPKNIILKLSSRMLRDNFLGSFRLAKGLKTDEVGFSGTSHPIYMHEHLTLHRKDLFREAREAARKKGFKYVWVKHATVLVRETDGSATIAIRSKQDILKIKPNNKPNQ